MNNNHFAKVENGRVTQVIVAEQAFIDSGAVGDPSQWIATDYYTRNNLHYNLDGVPDGGVAVRGTYANIGHVYDPVNDEFYPPSPFPSWTRSTDVDWAWIPPVPRPTPIPGYSWEWNESLLSWISTAVMKGNVWEVQDDFDLEYSNTSSLSTSSGLAESNTEYPDQSHVATAEVVSVGGVMRTLNSLPDQIESQDAATTSTVTALPGQAEFEKEYYG